MFIYTEEGTYINLDLIETLDVVIYENEEIGTYEGYIQAEIKNKKYTFNPLDSNNESELFEWLDERINYLFKIKEI